MLNMTVPPNVCQLPDQGKTVLAELALRLVKGLQLRSGDQSVGSVVCTQCRHQRIFKVVYGVACLKCRVRDL